MKILLIVLTSCLLKKDIKKIPNSIRFASRSVNSIRSINPIKSANSIRFENKLKFDNNKTDIKNFKITMNIINEQDIILEIIYKKDKIVSALIKLKIEEHNLKFDIVSTCSRHFEQNEIDSIVNNVLKIILSSASIEAVEKNDLLSLKKLIKQNINQKSLLGESALTVACRLGNAEAVRILLDKGADVNQINYLEDSPLIIATRMNHIDIVKILLNDKKINPFYKNRFKLDARGIARSKNNIRLLEILPTVAARAA